jgi:hypothetical protein
MDIDDFLHHIGFAIGYYLTDTKSQEEEELNDKTKPTCVERFVIWFVNKIFVPLYYIIIVITFFAMLYYIVLYFLSFFN